MKNHEYAKMEFFYKKDLLYLEKIIKSTTSNKKKDSLLTINTFYAEWCPNCHYDVKTLKEVINLCSDDLVDLNLIMMLSSDEIKAFTKQSSAGSIHKGIRHGVLKAFNLPYGGKEITESFSELVNPILQKSFLLNKENQKLEQLRDWLLPMLMNGQVKIN